jgi:dihydrofolate synthase/folylpolyglutamate synthase
MRTLDDWLTYIQSVHFRSVDMSLERVREVYARLFPAGPAFAVISVAGTNGKGSTVAMLDACLRVAGKRAGAYTSPHLVRHNERVCVNGVPATDAEFCVAFERIEEARGAIPLTYFEFGTLAALLIFTVRGVEVAVLEVGMGGRLDAVNICDADASLVTAIGLDHQHWLGPDRDAIGFEKAGIFRPGRPAVCSDPRPPATIAAYAAKVGARFLQIGKDYYIEDRGGEWCWHGPAGARLNLPRPQLRGAFQLYNAAGVVTALKMLSARLPVADGSLREGMARATVRGRFQRLREAPEVMADVCHNAQAAYALRENLRALPRSGRTLAVCGMLRDKPVEQVTAILSPLVDEWHAAVLEGPRGMSAGEIGARISDGCGGRQPVRVHNSAVAAYDAALSAAAARDRILVFGSFHTVGDIIALRFSTS